MQIETIKNIIVQHLPQSQVYIDGDGRHFTAMIVSDAFIGKSPVARQQLVYSALTPYIEDGRLHALSMKTLTHAEWEQNHG